MNKKSIAAILLASVLLSSCSIIQAKETTEEEVTTTVEETTTTTTEETTSETTEAYTPTTTASTRDSKFEGLQAGDVFTFGQYEGEDIEWVILSITMNVCYCLANESIDSMPYDQGGEVYDWNNSSLSIWLNGDFYENSFTDEEKVRIRYCLNSQYPEVDSDNKIYLLNRVDVNEYASILDEHPAGNSWWLRSKSNSEHTHADICSSRGNITYDGMSLSSRQGVRPAMKLYMGTSDDMLDLANLTPTPTPTPSPTPTPAPGYSPEMPPVPEEMPYDDTLGEEANLENYYVNNIQGLYGTAAATSVSIETADYNDFFEPWLNINGALSHEIADFDGDGDLELVAFVFVTELDDAYIENTENYYFHLHLLLCDDVDGTIMLLDDLPVMTRWTNSDGELTDRFDEYHCGMYSNTYYTHDIGLYTIDRDGKELILMTITDSASPMGDGFDEAAFVWEISGNSILYSSSYCAGAGSDDTRAVEISYENGEVVSSDWYYMYPDQYDAPGMVQGIEFYIERLGMSCADRADGYGLDITGPNVTPIIRCGVDWVSLEEQYQQPFLFTYYVVEN